MRLLAAVSDTRYTSHPVSTNDSKYWFLIMSGISSELTLDGSDAVAITERAALWCGTLGDGPGVSLVLLSGFMGGIPEQFLVPFLKFLSLCMHLQSVMKRMIFPQ